MVWTFCKQRPQFSLRSIFLATVGVALLCSVAYYVPIAPLVMFLALCAMAWIRRRHSPEATPLFLGGVSSRRASTCAAAGEEVQRQVRACEPTSRRRLWLHFLAGLAYTALVATFFSGCTQCAFPFVFTAVLSGFFVCGGLGLWWLKLRVTKKDARLGQFSVGSLLFLMAFVAMFFGTVRWIVVRVSQQEQGLQADSVTLFCIFAPICLVLAPISMPFVLRMIEAVIWAAVWFVKRPPVHRWIRGRRKTSGVRWDSETPPT
jgi:hypothetical protein